MPARRSVRRRHAAPRCDSCRMHVGLCFCSVIPSLRTRTRVVLVTHRIEDRKSTNTGRIAMACLPDGHVVVRGLKGDAGDDDLRESSLPPNEGELLVLFPHDDAEPITSVETHAKPITLVVPDGTWRQASKVRARVPGLARARAVTLPEGPASRYRLRNEAHETHLSTLEALARALEILEGDRGPEIRGALERVLDTMVDRTRWVKGEIADVDVTGGVPKGAQRHDPRSGIRHGQHP